MAITKELFGTLPNGQDITAYLLDNGNGVSARILNYGGITEYYKYCKFRNGNMYWFEFISPHAYHDIYDVYINDIYGTFKVN